MLGTYGQITESSMGWSLNAKVPDMIGVTGVVGKDCITVAQTCRQIFLSILPGPKSPHINWLNYENSANSLCLLLTSS